MKNNIIDAGYGATHGSANYGVLEMDVSLIVPTANENRPYNFNSKWYVKI